MLCNRTIIYHGFHYLMVGLLVYFESAAAFDTCQLRRLQMDHINMCFEVQGSHNHPLFAVSLTKVTTEWPHFNFSAVIQKLQHYRGWRACIYFHSLLQLVLNTAWRREKNCQQLKYLVLIFNSFYSAFFVRICSAEKNSWSSDQLV